MGPTQMHRVVIGKTELGFSLLRQWCIDKWKCLGLVGKRSISEKAGVFLGHGLTLRVVPYKKRVVTFGLLAATNLCKPV